MCCYIIISNIIILIISLTLTAVIERSFYEQAIGEHCQINGKEVCNEGFKNYLSIMLINGAQLADMLLHQKHLYMHSRAQISETILISS